MNEQLKPCPCCGCEKVVIEQYKKDGLRIICKRCALKSEQRVASQTIEWLDGVMIRDWNTRADGWISVHDKKPKYGAPVILSVNDVVQDITYNLDGSDDSLDWFEPYSSVGAYDDFKDTSFFVTHDIDVKWMQLPNPPKAASCGE